MVDLARLRGQIAFKEMTHKSVAKALKLSEKTFYNKMKTGKFYLHEAEKLIDLLAIEKPEEIFFNRKGTRYVPIGHNSKKGV